jgi:predicted CXXCH cytochrome family protein
MKKIIIILAVFFLAGTVFAQGTIAGSAHDFSSNNWDGNSEICIVCHTPHNANAEIGAPLWNHENSAAASFTVYTSSTFDATAGQPAGTSKLCLSCHDGTVAIDNFGARTPTAGMISTDFEIGTDLTNDHPVSFVYSDATAGSDGGLKPPSTATGITGTIETDMLFGSAGSATMECASCHDVHNSADELSLLVKTNAGSALCLTCHDK